MTKRFRGKSNWRRGILLKYEVTMNYLCWLGLASAVISILGLGFSGPGYRLGLCETGEGEVLRQDRGRDSGCIPGSDMAQCDAAGVNGSNRIISHGAPHPRMMPNGCLGSPVLVLLWS